MYSEIILVKANFGSDRIETNSIEFELFKFFDYFCAFVVRSSVRSN